jgi:gliding motility-associated-like protein
MFNTTVNFQNTSFNGYTYQWFFEDGYPSQSTQEDVDVSFPDGVTGTYDITLITTSQLGCSDTMDYELIVFPEVLIYAPNTFTPDGDEFNQDWLIHMEGVDLYDFELLIFNRWGEVVWESHDITVPWDGMYNGKPLKQGMYNWVVRTKDILNDGKYTYTGHVTILR